MIPSLHCEGVIGIRDLKKWIVGLMAVALLAAGVLVLAGNGLGRGAPESTESCPAATGGNLCDQDSDGDGVVNSEDPDWVCPANETGCGGGSATCQSLTVNGSFGGTGFVGSCGRGFGRGFGGCRGSRL
jgi:hypothetical protein